MTIVDSSSSFNPPPRVGTLVGNGVVSTPLGEENTKASPRSRRRRSRVYVGEWWFDTAGLRWDARIGR